MKLTANHAKFQIYDDVLPAAEFARLWKFIGTETYWLTHAPVWQKVWRIEDGNPLSGPSAYSNQAAYAALSDNGKINVGPYRMFPTGEPIDALVSRIQAHAGDWTTLLGRENDDWVGFVARLFLYPRGTALSWHADSKDYAGAFTYYAHPYWNVQYGGELFLAEVTRPLEESPDYATRALDNADENDRLMEHGIGHYVQAKPNRLVIVKAGVPHCVRAVTPAAGDRVRTSIAGFFAKKKPATAA